MSLSLGEFNANLLQADNMTSGERAGRMHHVLPNKVGFRIRTRDELTETVAVSLDNYSFVILLCSTDAVLFAHVHVTEDTHETDNIWSKVGDLCARYQKEKTLFGWHRNTYIVYPGHGASWIARFIEKLDCALSSKGMPIATTVAFQVGEIACAQFTPMSLGARLYLMDSSGNGRDLTHRTDCLACWVQLRPGVHEYVRMIRQKTQGGILIDETIIDVSQNTPLNDWIEVRDGGMSVAWMLWDGLEWRQSPTAPSTFTCWASTWM